MAYSIAQLQKAIDTTPWPGAGLCLGWVTDVFENLGLDVTHFGTAREAYYAWGTTDYSGRKPGMIIAWYGNSEHTAGHIGIYIDDQHVYNSAQTVLCETLSAIMSNYSSYGEPKFGWCMGAQISSHKARGSSHCLLLDSVYYSNIFY